MELRVARHPLCLALGSAEKHSPRYCSRRCLCVDQTGCGWRKECCQRKPLLFSTYHLLVRSYGWCQSACHPRASSIETIRRRLLDGFSEVNGKQRVRDVGSMRVPSHQGVCKTDYRLTSSQENTLLERFQCISSGVRLADMSMSTQSQKYVRQPCQ